MRVIPVQGAVNPMDYDLLIFDADGTLFDYDTAERWAFTAMCRDLHTPYSEQFHESYRTINHQIWKEFEQGTIDGKQLKAERFSRLFTASGRALDPLAASSLYLERLGQTGFLIDGAMTLLEALTGRYRLALLTNGIAKTQHGRLDASGIRGYFDPIIISEETGYQKPDPRIFEVLFSQAGHTAKDRALMIGDSLSSDIAGGAAFGIDTCLVDLDHSYTKETQAGPAPTMVVDSLKALSTLLT